ncbi:MAG: hypothetical protein JWO77_543 [Ilumatobacteraceae bacterium]|nr:hypothetical protein [Ilumatobacteraceae bacterium]
MTTDAPATGRRTVYTGRTTNWPVVALTVALALALIVMGWSSEGSWSGLALNGFLISIGIILEILTGSSVRVAAGPNGLAIRWGLIGWPRCTYPLDQIAAAEVVDLPMHRVSYGLWWTPRRTHSTIRRGPTVQLTLTSGRIVLATAPDPARAVQALTDARTA